MKAEEPFPERAAGDNETPKDTSAEACGARDENDKSSGGDPILREAPGHWVDASPHSTESSPRFATDDEGSAGSAAKEEEHGDTHNTGEWCATLEKKCNRLCFDLSVRNEVDVAVAALEKLRIVMKYDATRRATNLGEPCVEESDDFVARERVSAEA